MTADVPGCEAYIDDVIVYSDTWNSHPIKVICKLFDNLKTANLIRKLFDNLKIVNLTVHLSKSVFGHAQFQFLGHVVGGGEVKQITAKVNAINRFLVPNNKKELMRFLGMAGYYRQFCRNLTVIVEPLINVVHKDKKFEWQG